MDWLTPIIIFLQGACSAPDPCIKVPGFNAPEVVQTEVSQPEEKENEEDETTRDLPQELR